MGKYDYNVYSIQKKLRLAALVNILFITNTFYMA